MIPGDRVRVTAGDWCGETGTVIGTADDLAIIGLDTGGQLVTVPERLEASMRDVELPKQQNADVRDAWAKATANYRRDIESIRKALPEIARQLNESASRMQRTIKNTQQFLIRSGLVEPPPPQDPRERALWVREHRNTGPDRSKYKHRGIK